VSGFAGGKEYEPLVRESPGGMTRRLCAMVALVALATAACSGDGGEVGRDAGPLRLVAERIVVLDNDTVAVAGIAATEGHDDACLPDRGEAWNLFVTRISGRGRVLRTDVLPERRMRSCGDLVIDAARAAREAVSVTGWVVHPAQSDGGSTHGPVHATFHRDGSVVHDFRSKRWLFDYGPIAYGFTRLPGGGSARMYGPRVGYSGLRLEIDRPGSSPVRVRSGALPGDARLYENYLYWYSLVADRKGVYGSGPYTRGDEGRYRFPIFRHRLDGTLDRSFDGDGVVFAHPPRVRHFVTTQIVLQPDGKVLAVGGAETRGRRVTYVMRFRRDGQLDPRFGRGGIVRLTLGRATQDSYADTRGALGVLDRGRIVVVGGIQARGSSVWLLEADGSIDRTFGRRGRLVLSPT
jgi:uncharacterized delta-60 repeat protein